MTLNVSTFRGVAHEFDRQSPPAGAAQEELRGSPRPQELLGRIADERLLAEGAALPAELARPAPVAPAEQRRWLVGLGATLTGVTLLGGLALIVVGIVGMISSGFAALAVAAVIAGLVLVATHWGWVHVAEATAAALEGRRDRTMLDRQRRWLSEIEPYTHHEVSTRVGEDGDIAIVRTRLRPLPSGEGRFHFVADVEHTEVHSADEPGAAVAERAEALRRQAALDTERERQRFREAVGELETDEMRRQQEQRLREALRAESQALSEGINANLRDPPLEE
ncbi:MAG: hypothetical protein JO342_12400 [Solirubrobacterales bacterium]|nr:hypothetical protein [Solirubrobacterales bacterium]